MALSHALTALLGLAALHPTAAVGDDTDACLQLADALFAAGSWEGAITEYKRYMFVNCDSLNEERCQSQIAECYLRLGEFQNALGAYRSAALAAREDSARQEQRINAGIVMAAMGDVSAAELEFTRVAVFGRDPSIQDRARGLLMECQLEASRWQDARRTWRTRHLRESNSRIARVDSIFDTMGSLPIRSQDVARRLSTWLPGLGQAYAGAVREGIHALALNAFMGYWLATSVVRGDVGDVLTKVGLFRRYYLGNRLKAADLTEERNRRLLEPCLRAIGEELRGTRAQNSALFEGRCARLCK